jgi:hypothetical protein
MKRNKSWRYSANSISNGRCEYIDIVKSLKALMFYSGKNLFYDENCPKLFELFVYKR